ncbi:hypothetical protein [Mongoliibacter ruber]|uniref:Uncharacterized protein n=1 Tax=Mongoliibacter ruber TaxID=1750599 RepID=A0A2T0WVB0_9BACT|nr:hypothetical protein [Mongoliibacter ruber]PRY90617.1 hypothetical protein CLW00_101281 [Mongoliibacter ruber]
MTQEEVNTGIFLLEIDIQVYENKLRYIHELQEEDRIKLRHWKEIKEKELQELKNQLCTDHI